MTSPIAQSVIPPINSGDLPGSREFFSWEALLQTVLGDFFMPILAGLAVLYLIWAGYQYLTSAGDPTAAEKARHNLTYSIIGVILVALAYVLVQGTVILINQSANRL